ncbi:MAG: HPr family phosphocarrier protein [Spirochaetaceae bacterium]|jgi:phosphocarrier protein HPr|nr:HPr family phosphocarrier protein [Spirochaetaceae bacterium]
MVQKIVEIVNETGLHTRPGNQFVKEAKKYESDITVKKGDKEFSAKSLLKLMKIGISKGDQIEVICNGPDEEAALENLCSFIANLTD